MRAPSDPTGRRSLPHDPPHFIGTGNAIFFITICCQPKGLNQLCYPDTSKTLFDAAGFYYNRHDWGVPILLLMPDHLHMLARFGPGGGMKKTVTSCKRYTATRTGIRWQRDFFDHRLRSDESFHESDLHSAQSGPRRPWSKKLKIGLTNFNSGGRSYREICTPAAKFVGHLGEMSLPGKNNE